MADPVQLPVCWDMRAGVKTEFGMPSLDGNLLVRHCNPEQYHGDNLAELANGGAT